MQRIKEQAKKVSNKSRKQTIKGAVTNEPKKESNEEKANQ